VILPAAADRVTPRWGGAAAPFPNRWPVRR